VASSNPVTGSCPGTAVLADTNSAVPSGGGLINSFSSQGSQTLALLKAV
jgi:hypothetical protein